MPYTVMCTRCKRRPPRDEKSRWCQECINQRNAHYRAIDNARQCRICRKSREWLKPVLCLECLNKQNEARRKKYASKPEWQCKCDGCVEPCSPGRQTCGYHSRKRKELRRASKARLQSEQVERIGPQEEAAATIQAGPSEDARREVDALLDWS